MKILIPIFIFGRAGGMRVLSKIANEWVNLGHQVDFLVNIHSEDPYYPTQANIIKYSNAGSVIEKQTSRMGKIVKRSSELKPTLVYALYKAIKSLNTEYDAIISNYSFTAWSVALNYKTKATKIYYIQAYEPDFFDINKGLKYFLAKIASYFSYYLPLKQIVNSSIYFTYPGIRTNTMIPPGIDFSIMHPNYKKNSKNNKLVIGCIGREEVWKGTQLVIDAYKKLSKINNDIELKIAFYIPENERSSDIISAHPNNDAELADFYRSLDILIAPGLIQLGAHHYPVLEAFACGIPVITTGYEPATNENAWIVPINDSDAIKNAIELIISNPEITNRKKDKAIISVENYNWPILASNMLNEINSEK